MIEKIGKNKARLIINIGSGKNRRRKTKTVTYTSKKELKEMYRKFENEVRHNPLTDTNVTELVEAYIRSRRTLGVEETTLAGYESISRNIFTLIGDLNASQLTSYQVQEFISTLGEKYAPKTIRNTVSLLSASYDNAVRLGQLQNNPCRYVNLPKKEQPKIDIFNDEEIARFLEALPTLRLDYEVAYKLALFCGMRRSEILGLRESDINIPFRTVTISRSRHKVKGEDVIQKTKTETSHRTLALPDFIVSDIERLIEEHHSKEYEVSDYLIQDGFGKPMTPSALTQAIVRLEKNNELPNVSLHDLRHTFASMLNSNGVDIARISAELGHSNISTTLSVYTHVFGGASASSRGIADMLNDKVAKSATSMPLDTKKNA